MFLFLLFFYWIPSTVLSFRVADRLVLKNVEIIIQISGRTVFPQFQQNATKENFNES